MLQDVNDPGDAENSKADTINWFVNSHNCFLFSKYNHQAATMNSMLFGGALHLMSLAADLIAQTGFSNQYLATFPNRLEKK